MHFTIIKFYNYFSNTNLFHNLYNNIKIIKLLSYQKKYNYFKKFFSKGLINKLSTNKLFRQYNIAIKFILKLFHKYKLVYLQFRFNINNLTI